MPVFRIASALFILWLIQPEAIRAPVRYAAEQLGAFAGHAPGMAEDLARECLKRPELCRAVLKAANGREAGSRPARCGRVITKGGEAAAHSPLPDGRGAGGEGLMPGPEAEAASWNLGPNLSFSGSIGTGDLRHRPMIAAELFFHTNLHQALIPGLLPFGRRGAWPYFARISAARGAK